MGVITSVHVCASHSWPRTGVRVQSTCFPGAPLEDGYLGQGGVLLNAPCGPTAVTPGGGLQLQPAEFPADQRVDLALSPTGWRTQAPAPAAGRGPLGPRGLAITPWMRARGTAAAARHPSHLQLFIWVFRTNGRLVDETCPLLCRPLCGHSLSSQGWKQHTHEDNTSRAVPGVSHAPSRLQHSVHHEAPPTHGPKRTLSTR